MTLARHGMAWIRCTSLLLPRLRRSVSHSSLLIVTPLLALAACDFNPEEPLTEPDPVMAILTAMAQAHGLAQDAATLIAEHRGLQSISALSKAFTYGGQSFSAAKGKTFIYDPTTVRYRPDPTRQDAPSNGVRFLLYASANESVVLPLQEIGHLDLLDNGSFTDSALTVRATVDQVTTLEYGGHGAVTQNCYGSSCSTTSRLAAAGTLWAAAAIGIEVSDRRDTPHSFTLMEYDLTLPMGRLGIKASVPGPAYFDYDPGATVTVTLAPRGSAADSTRVVVNWGSLRCHEAFTGMVYVDGDSLIVGQGQRPIGPNTYTSYRLGIHYRAGRADTTVSDTLDAFWKLVASPCGGLMRALRDGVGNLLDPVEFAFRVASSPPRRLTIVTRTSGTDLDPDGYLATLLCNQRVFCGDTVIARGLRTQDTVVFAELPQADYTVALTGGARNCVVDGRNWGDFTLARDTTVAFSVRCGGRAIHGGEMVFVARGVNQSTDLFRIHADGTGLINLTASPGDEDEPSWSRDGTRLAFVGLGPFPQPQADVYRINADGSDRRNLTQSTARNLAPCWSPDGSRIAFLSNRDGNLAPPICPTCSRDPLFELYLMNSDGTGLLNLTRNTATGTNNYPAAWSPDGSRLVLPSTRGGQWGIYVMNADGSEEVRVSPNTGLLSTADASWSPDGSRILFWAQLADYSFSLYLVNPDGTDLVQVTNSRDYDARPQWSPDGSRVAFLRRLRVFLVNRDGSGLAQLTDVEVGDSPRWSPDGARLALTCNAPGRLCVAASDGSWVMTLLAPGPWAPRPDWRP